MNENTRQGARPFRGRGDHPRLRLARLLFFRVELLHQAVDILGVVLVELVPEDELDEDGELDGGDGGGANETFFLRFFSCCVLFFNTPWLSPSIMNFLCFSAN